MKVKELIEKLKKLDQEKSIYLRRDTESEMVQSADFLTEIEFKDGLGYLLFSQSHVDVNKYCWWYKSLTCKKCISKDDCKREKIIGVGEIYEEQQ